MSQTVKGKVWEFGHSLWMLWFLTLGFLNGVAFIYIGQRTRHFRWTAWGLIYLVPFALMLIYSIATDGKLDPAFENVGALDMMGVFLVAIISPIHGFKVRREYLMRLEAIEKRAPAPQELQRRIAQEYDREAPKPRSAFRHKRDGGALVSRRRFDHAQAALHHDEPVRAMPVPERLAEFQRMLLVHQVGVGKQKLDVAEPPVALVDLIAELEREGLIEVVAGDIGYHLSQEGHQRHVKWMDQAQELIRAYDIYGDVDEDADGTLRFDTGLGKDLRVPAYEDDKVDPFFARVLLGLNDGEWADQADWERKLASEAWFAEVFAPVRSAPSVAMLGAARIEHIKEQAKARLRQGRPVERSAP